MSKFQSTIFAFDVLKIVTGTTFAQIIAFLSAPIISRLYGPDSFGILGIFTSITAIIGVVACLSLQNAILLPKKDEEAINLLSTCIIISITISLLTLIVLYFCENIIITLFGVPEISPYLILIPFYILTYGVFLALNFWSSRTKHFGRISIAQITQSTIATGTRLGMGFVGNATGGSLIGAQVLGMFVSTFILGFKILRDDLKIFRKSISWSIMITLLKRYNKFPLIDSISSLLNEISWQLPIIILAYFFSPKIVGYYTLGFMVFQMPMNLIGDSIGKVFLQRAANARYEDTLSILVENVFRILFMIGLYPILTITILGPEFFSVFFGDIWYEAGVYAQILGLWSFVWFLTSPIGSIITVLEKLEFRFLFNCINLLSRFLSLFIGALFGGPIIALLLFSLSGIIVYGFLNIKILKFSGVKIINIKKNILQCITIVTIISLILIGLKFFNVKPFLLIISSIFLSVVYYLYIIKNDYVLYNFIKDLISKKH